MQLDLPMGPWTRLVSAQWGDYPLAIYQNPDKLMLLALFEKDAEMVKGALVFLKKGFLLEGDPSKFSISQRRDMTLMYKYSKDQLTKYLLIGSSPMYIEYALDSLIKAVNEQYSELDNLSRATVEILKGYDCKATEFRILPEEKLQQVLGDPFSLFGIFATSGGVAPASTASMRCPVGIEKGGELLEVRMNSLALAGVSGGEARDRLHAVHILVEGALLNNLPAVVFDAGGTFAGLSLPNKDQSRYEQFRMTSIPLGFPFKEYGFDNGLFIDLSGIPPDAFIKSFHLEQSDIAPVIAKAFGAGAASLPSLSDLIVALSSLKDSPEMPKYSINKAVRALEVIQKCHPGVFAKSSGADFAPSSGLGKVVHISLRGAPPEVAQMAVFAVLKTLSGTVSPGLRVIAAFGQDASLVSPEVKARLAELRTRGVGAILQAEHSIDLEGAGNFSLKAELVGSEAVVSEEGQGQKRVTVRPAYSHDSEY